MINLRLFILNKKKFMNALFINTMSFAIYIIAQQLLFMPLMGRWLDHKVFADFVVYIAVFSIASNALGGELGIVNQVDENSRETNFKHILKGVSIISSIITFIVLLALGFAFVDALLLSVVIIIANYRLYAGGYFRKKKQFRNVLIQNILYLLGMGIGLIAFYYCRVIWLPSLLAEVASIPFSIFQSDLAHDVRKRPDSHQIKRFFSFSFISLLNNLITYLDKIILYPILGPLAVDIYYSTTAMSKVANMIVNPLHSVLLSWIRNKDKQIIIRRFILISWPAAVASAIICIPLTYIALNILYPQFSEYAMPIILPVSIALGASIGSALLKSLLLKFSGNKKLMKIYIAYFLFFLVFGVISSSIWGIVGFCYSIAATKTILYLEFIISLKKIGSIKSEKNN